MGILNKNAVKAAKTQSSTRKKSGGMMVAVVLFFAVAGIFLIGMWLFKMGKQKIADRKAKKDQEAKEALKLANPIVADNTLTAEK